MTCSEMKGLCVREDIAATLLQKGFTFGDDTAGHMMKRLDDLVGHAEMRCKMSTPQDSGMVWITPYIILQNREDHTCFVSRRKEEVADYFEPFSLGIAAGIRCGETAEQAVMRMLKTLFGYSYKDIVSGRLVGFIWSDASPMDSAHIAVVFQVVVEDTHGQMVEEESFKGLWMTKREVEKTWSLVGLTPWSRSLWQAEMLLGTLFKASTTSLNRVVSDLISKSIENQGGCDHEACYLGS